MKKPPDFELPRLREIGWALWDPIGLSGLEGNAADEYDSYLLVAAARLWNGASQAAVAEYLVAVETEHMGLGDAPGVRSRARQVVRALSAYVGELRARNDE